MQKKFHSSNDTTISWEQLSPGSVPYPVPSIMCKRNADGVGLKINNHRSIQLNTTAEVIWRLSDGETTAQEISDTLVEFYNISPTETLKSVFSTIKALEDNGAISVRRKLKHTQPVILNAHWIGRFGNRMHQYAYATQYAQLHGAAHWTVSEWEGTSLFKNRLHDLVPDEDLRNDLVQAGFVTRESSRFEVLGQHAARTGWKFERLYPQDSKQAWQGSSIVAFDNLCAYEEHIFKGLNARFLLDEVFVFSDEVKNLEIYKRLQDQQGSYDIAHLRRGDLADLNYTNNINSVVSKASYLRAFKQAGLDPATVRWVTDDTTGDWGAGTAKQPFGWSYPSGSHYQQGSVFDWIDDFLKLYFARTVFRSNSSFSFWACFLSQQRETPCRVFAPRLDRSVPYWSSEAEKQGTDFNFEEGNHPHWMWLPNSSAPDIIINDHRD